MEILESQPLDYKSSALTIKLNNSKVSAGKNFCSIQQVMYLIPGISKRLCSCLTVEENYCVNHLNFTLIFSL